MSDMRLIVAGAGGRMGRALTRAISETSGAVLTGALEAPGSELLGKDAGTLAVWFTSSAPPVCRPRMMP
jgi:4-hydroxy-tetrahydrodipicolinate reductase